MASTTPLLILDKTISDFYAEELQGEGEHAVLLPCYPVGHHDHRCDHRNDDGVHDRRGEFIYQTGQTDMEDFDFAPARKKDTSGARTRLQSLGQLKFSQVAGNMDIVCFRVHGVHDLGSVMKDHIETLHPSQRARIHPVMNAGSLQANDDSKTKAIFLARVPMDGLRYPPREKELLFTTDIHTLYELNTKRCLALAPFHTPKADIVDFLKDSEISNPKRAVKTYSSDGVNRNFIPNKLISAFIRDVVQVLDNRTLPYVMKVQQTADGQGTWIVKTEKDRHNLKCVISSILRYSISQTTWENAHLRCASIIFTDFIANSGLSYAITLFIKRTGQVEFIGCAEQTIGENNSWEGALIRYLMQAFLQDKFDALTQEVARYLHSRNYYGFVGIDVIEDQAGKFWVVDMNVRPPGSLILGLLNGFMTARKLHIARLISQKKMHMSKEEFITTYKHLLADGRIIIHAWFYDLKRDEDWASLVVAGAKQEDVDGLIDLISSIEGEEEAVVDGEYSDGEGWQE